MIYITRDTQIQLAVKPQDFRKQIDGLAAVVQQHLGKNPKSGALFVFINRARTMVRILSYQENGYWVATKRLTKGKFTGWPSASEPVCELAAKRLSRIIRGLGVDHEG